MPAKAAAPPLRSPIENEFTKLDFDYLESNGWELQGYNNYGIGIWRDPMSAGGDRGVRTKIADLPVKDGKGIGELYQTVCPPVRWDLTTGEAVATQRRRDEAGKTGTEASPLTRLDRMGETVKQMLGKEVSISDELARLLQRNVPTHPDAIRAELGLMRKGIREAINRLRGIENTAAA